MQANPDLNTYLLPSMLSPMIYLNPRTPGFAEQADRLAFLSGLDFPALVDAAYGPLATSQSGVLPMRMLDASLNHDVVSYDDAALAALAAGSLKDESIEIVYSSNDPGGSNLSDNIAAALNVVGIKATSTGLDSGAFWSTVFDPEKAPDIVAFTGLPDAGHPDTWARIYYTPTDGLEQRWLDGGLGWDDFVVDGRCAASRWRSTTSPSRTRRGSAARRSASRCSPTSASPSATARPLPWWASPDPASRQRCGSRRASRSATPAG
ncbi:MAG: hypothetical protein KDB41_00405 [Propionibacteriaceae bacterium]|nr:hypothetical protein [Propionibacteriaceae bacterium]